MPERPAAGPVVVSRIPIMSGELDVSALALDHEHRSAGVMRGRIRRLAPAADHAIANDLPDEYPLIMRIDGSYMITRDRKGHLAEITNPRTTGRELAGDARD